LAREGERAELRGQVDAAVAGAGGFVVVEGPAGIGKTTLLDDAAAAAAGRGMRVLRARGGELERDHPLGVARRLLDGAVGDPAVVAAAGPAAEPAVAALDRVGDGAGAVPGFPVLHGCWWLVQALAADGPLAIVVDDLQWVDPASLQVLGHVAARVDELPVLLVAGTRDPDPDVVAVDPPLARVPRAATLAPAPLGADDAGRLVARELGTAIAPDVARACRDATDGNPFLLTELARALREDAAPPSVERIGALAPRSVSRALLLRLGGHGPAPLALARALAILAEESDLGVAAAVAGLDPQVAAEAADVLVRADVLAGAHPLRFRHPIVRAAIRADTGPGERGRLHAAAAERLLMTASPAHPAPAAVAVHLLHAPTRGSAATAAVLLEAGQDATRRGAPEEGLRFLERALAEPPDEETRPDVLAALAEAGLHARLDLPTAGQRLAESAAATLDPDQAVQRWLLLAQLVTVGRGIPAAVALLEEAMRRMDDHPDARRRVAVDLVGKALLHPDTRARADALAREAPGVAGGDATIDRLERCNLAWALALGGAPAAEVRALAGPTLARGATSRETGPSAPVYQAIAALSQVDAFDEALACADAAVAVARGRHQTLGLYGALGTRASIHWRAGNVRACADDARASLDLPGVPGPFQIVSAGWLALAQLAADDADGAAATLDAVADVPVIENVNSHVVEAAQALLLAARGEHDAALARLDDLDRRRRASGTRALLPWRGEHVVVALRAGDEEGAHALVTALEADAEAVGTPAGRGLARRCRARVTDDRARAEALLRDAEARLRGSGCRLLHAEALVELGMEIRRAGRRAEARPVLEEGLREARRCGALRLAALAHDELTVAGSRPRRLQFSGADALTPSERRIADLAASGSTNRAIAQELYVTPKTVENQLGRVYRKLGIGSRTELADALGSPLG
jgi:DNA-binding CsgD family transcriptional regulator